MNTKDFDKLPKEHQIFRWALFLYTDGYQKDISLMQFNALYEKYVVNKASLDVNEYN